MTIAEGRLDECARDVDLWRGGDGSSSSSPSSSCVCGGAGRDGRLLTLERDAETLDLERDRERVTPVTGACSPPGLKESVAMDVFVEDMRPNCCCCCCC